MIARVAALTFTAAMSLVVGGSLNVTLKTPGHTPKINTHWNYTVTVRKGGKPVAARLTEQIVDPVGGVHAVQFGKSTKNITNWPIKGAFSDFIIWPASARGVPLTFRVIVKVGTAKKVVNFSVVAHG
jgi:hypothetical protein